MPKGCARALKVSSARALRRGEGAARIPASKFEIRGTRNLDFLRNLLRAQIAASRPGFIYKHLLVLLKIEPICDSVFNTRSLNIEAASVGGLIFIWANHFEKRLPGLQRVD
jgi:hypothetical protein